MSNASPCVACPSSSLGFCAAVLGARPSPDRAETWQHHAVVHAGKQILAPNKPISDVYVLCGGWGFRLLQLPDGRRHILNFLLPGDLFSATSVFEERFHFSVKALTAVQVSGMSRAEVQSRLSSNPAVLTALAKFCAREADAADEAMAALGQFSAEERIAHLFLHLMERIAARNVIRGQRYPFPLRQQHIADAVGLTPVHVSRVLSIFRDRHIAELSDGVLEVFDPDELERLGSFA